MDYQLWAVLGFLAVAIGYLLFMAMRSWRRIRTGQCSTSCGCPSKPKQETPGLIDTNDLTRRLEQKRHA
jgi:hypothetical protein